MADIEGVSKQLTSLIPELYYDLISRVIPGVAILAVVIGLLKGWAYLVSIPQTLNFGSATIFLIATMTAAYLAATLCLPIGEFGRYLLTPFLWRFVVRSSRPLVHELEDEINRELEVEHEPKLSLIRTWNPSKINMAYRIVHERLREDGKRAVILSKLQAETALCTVLLGFFLLSLGATLLRHLLPQEAELFLGQPSVFAVGLMGFLLTVFALIFRNLRLWNKHLSKLHENRRRKSDQLANRAIAN